LPGACADTGAFPHADALSVAHAVAVAITEPGTRARSCADAVAEPEPQPVAEPQPVTHARAAAHAARVEQHDALLRRRSRHAQRHDLRRHHGIEHHVEREQPAGVDAEPLAGRAAGAGTGAWPCTGAESVADTGSCADADTRASSDSESAAFAKSFARTVLRGGGVEHHHALLRWGSGAAQRCDLRGAARIQQHLEREQPARVDAQLVGRRQRLLGAGGSTRTPM
jgi:hypothetical protein